MCATNTALTKPTLVTGKSSTAGSQLAVDGKYLPKKSHYFCDHLDDSRTVWGIDLLETMKVFAVNISTHGDGEDTHAIEVCCHSLLLKFRGQCLLQIRVGNDADFTENQICWFILKLPAGKSSVYKCSEALEGRSILWETAKSKSNFFLGL